MSSTKCSQNTSVFSALSNTTNLDAATVSPQSPSLTTVSTASDSTPATSSIPDPAPAPSKRPRDHSVDLIKALALFSVVGVHFFLNTQFNYIDLSHHEIETFISFVIRAAMSVCVPLFLMATGFLMKNKKFSFRYYAGLIKIVIMYLVVSLLCILFRIYYFGDLWYTEDLNWLWSITGFYADGYAWYVEMFLGLFVIIPFLNLIYNNMSRLGRLSFLCILFVIVAIPAQANFEYPLFPSWWNDRIYPILYYFLGAYMCDYRSNKTKSFIFILFFGWCLLCAAFNMWVCFTENSSIFGWQEYNDWDSIQCVVASILAFSLILKINIERAPGWIKNIITVIASATLTGYLFSWITDQMIYPYLIEFFGGYFEMLPFMFFIVVGMFVIVSLGGILLYKACSLVSNPLTRWTADLLAKLQEKTKEKMDKWLREENPANKKS